MNTAVVCMICVTVTVRPGRASGITSLKYFKMIQEKGTLFQIEIYGILGYSPSHTVESM